MLDDERSSDNLMHGVRLGERQGLAHETRVGLSQAVIPTFHVVCLPFTFSYTAMCVCWEDNLVSLPQITEALTTFITCWDALPEQLTGLLTAITDGIGDDLACTMAHSSPKPTFLPVFLHKRPHFIHFEHIFCLRWQERIFKPWIVLVFF